MTKNPTTPRDPEELGAEADHNNKDMISYAMGSETSEQIRAMLERNPIMRNTVASLRSQHAIPDRRELLEKARVHKDIPSFDPESYTDKLQLADEVILGNVGKVKELLRDQDADQRDPDTGRSLLALAKIYGQTRVASLLESQGAALNPGEANDVERFKAEVEGFATLANRR